MFSQEEYQNAWLVYGASSIVLLLCWWWFVAKIPGREVRHLLRIIPLILLVVPWRTDLENSYLSPAWFTSVADTLTHGPQAFWRAGLALVIALMLGVLLSFFYFCWCWVKAYRNKNNSSDGGDRSVNRDSINKPAKTKSSRSKLKKPKHTKLEERKEPIFKL